MTFLKQIDGRWQGRGNASPRDFFQSAEPGFYLDFSATAPLYQDNVGATPLTLPDQQVGMALDVSRGMALGPELVTNGDFSAGATGWTLGAGWSVSGGAAVSAGGGNAALSQSGGTYVAGRTYQVTFNITVSSGYLLAYVANGNNAQISTSGAVSLRLVASASGGLAFFGFSFVGSIDNVSVREIKSVPAVQASLGLRPKWGRMPKTGKRNRLTYTEQFDNAVWLKTSATVTVNSDVAPDGTTTADLITFAATGGDQNIAGYNTLTGTYAISVYIKANNAGQVGRTVRFDTTGAGAASTVVTLTDSWQRVTISNAPTGYFQFRLISSSGTTASSFLLWGAQLEVGSTATAYQRVTNAFDVTEAGLPSYGFIRPDLMDDYLTVTTPAAQTGDVLVFGRKGTWLETGVTYGSGAAVAIGPTTMTGLPAGLLQAVQGPVSDISGGLVGVLAIGRTMTDTERTAALNYYKARGAAGLLTAGAELVASLISDNMWVQLPATPNSLVSGDQLTFGGQFSGRKYAVNATNPNSRYEFRFNARRISGNATISFFHEGSQSGTASPLTLTDTVSSYVILPQGEAGGGIVSFGFQDRNASGFGTVEVTNISVKELTVTP